MHTLLSVIASYSFLAYPVVFLGTIIEGDFTFLLFGALSHEGVVHFWGVVGVGILGSIAHDIIFWNIGRLIRQRRKKPLSASPSAQAVADVVSSNAPLYIFLSKFVWNFNRIILVTSGFVGVTFKTLIRSAVPAACLWVTVIMSLGFVFANQTAIFKQRLEIVGLILAGLLLTLIFIQFMLHRFFRLRVLKINGGKEK